MKVNPFSSFHVLRPYTAKNGSVSELVQQLRKVFNHSKAFPAPEKPKYIEIDLSKLVNENADDPKLEKTSEYKKLVADAKQKSNETFRQATWKNAYNLKKSYSANGGSFSYAQQIANKSGNYVIGIKGECSSFTPQQVLFKPQGKIKSILSNLGNFILNKLS